MHLIRVEVRGFHHSRRAGQLFVHILRVDEKGVPRWLLTAETLIEASLTWQPGTRRPGDTQLVGGLNGLPRLSCDDADKVVFDDHLHKPWQTPNRSFVDAKQRRSDDRRPDNLAVQHVR